MIDEQPHAGDGGAPGCLGIFEEAGFHRVVHGIEHHHAGFQQARGEGGVIDIRSHADRRAVDNDVHRRLIHIADADEVAFQLIRQLLCFFFVAIVGEGEDRALVHHALSDRFRGTACADDQNIFILEWPVWVQCFQRARAIRIITGPSVAVRHYGVDGADAPGGGVDSAEGFHDGFLVWHGYAQPAQIRFKCAEESRHILHQKRYVHMRQSGGLKRFVVE